MLRLVQAQALRDALQQQGAAFIVNDDVEPQTGSARTASIGATTAPSPKRAAFGSARDDRRVVLRLADARGVAVGGGATTSRWQFSRRRSNRRGARPVSLLTTAKARWDVPVVAIGGITLRTRRRLIAAGADAVAVITAGFAAPDIEASARALAALFTPHVA